MGLSTFCCTVTLFDEQLKWDEAASRVLSSARTAMGRALAKGLGTTGGIFGGAYLGDRFD